MACAKEVLTYIDFDAAGAEIRRCVQCDSAVDAKLGWVTGTELAARGYALGEPPLSKGCGGGCGSCSARR